MPGYGCAEVPKEVREAWTLVIKGFLRGRVPLKRAMVLVDSRHRLKDSDHEMMKLLDGSGVAFQIVLTKAGPAMLFGNLGFLLEAEAAEIEGGFGTRSQR